MLIDVHVVHSLSLLTAHFSFSRSLSSLLSRSSLSYESLVDCDTSLYSAVRRSTVYITMSLFFIFFRLIVRFSISSTIAGECMLITFFPAVVMSLFGKIFGGKKQEAVPTTQESIQKLLDTEELLMKKQAFLEAKIKEVGAQSFTSGLVKTFHNFTCLGSCHCGQAWN